MPLLYRHRLTVRFRDCDSLGHVNHAAYLTYCEEARFELWRRQLGFVVDQGHSHPDVPGFILARAEIDYRAQVRYGEVLEVCLSLDSLGRTSFTYGYDLMEASADRLVATAKTVLVLFDYGRQKSVPIEAALRAKLATPVST
jgi:acyl-CoA thioester hydrolase